jgi:hypothetical protein
MGDVQIIKKRGRKPKEKNDTPTQHIEDYVNTNMILHIPSYDTMDESIKNDDTNSTNQLEPFDKNMIYVMELNDQKNDNIISMKNQHHHMNTRKIHEINNFFNTEHTHNTNQARVCFWCTEPFQSIPIGLPFRVIHDRSSDSSDIKFCVYGYFCSFGCAGSYNFSLGDSQMNERFVMLNRLHDMIYNQSPVYKPLCLAPPRETLIKFGGFLTIEEFRKKSQNDVQYNIIIPPLMSLRCQIEEFYGQMNRKETNNSVYLDEERVNKAQYNMDKLKLKRSSALYNNNNNIENHMGIVIKKKF